MLEQSEQFQPFPQFELLQQFWPLSLLVTETNRF
jgi:hypothetical protein